VCQGKAVRQIIYCVAIWLCSMATSTAFAQSKDAAYFCVGEAAGGLWYNQQTRAGFAKLESGGFPKWFG
jgi:hypothetical protein